MSCRCQVFCDQSAINIVATVNGTIDNTGCPTCDGANDTNSNMVYQGNCVWSSTTLNGNGSSTTHVLTLAQDANCNWYWTLTVSTPGCTGATYSNQANPQTIPALPATLALTSANNGCPVWPSSATIAANPPSGTGLVVSGCGNPPDWRFAVADCNRCCPGPPETQCTCSFCEGETPEEMTVKIPSGTLVGEYTLTYWDCTGQPCTNCALSPDEGCTWTGAFNGVVRNGYTFDISFTLLMWSGTIYGREYNPPTYSGASAPLTIVSLFMEVTLLPNPGNCFAPCGGGASTTDSWWTMYTSPIDNSSLTSAGQLITIDDVGLNCLQCQLSDGPYGAMASRDCEFGQWTLSRITGSGNASTENANGTCEKVLCRGGQPDCGVPDWCQPDYPSSVNLWAPATEEVTIAPG